MRFDARIDDEITRIDDEITIIYENLRKMGQFSNLQKILYENLRKIEAKIFTLRTVRTKNRTLRNSQSPCYENVILYTL